MYNTLYNTILYHCLIRTHISIILYCFFIIFLIKNKNKIIGPQIKFSPDRYARIDG
jgi:hypothetical protein